MQRGKGHITKVVPRFDGPYTVVSAHPEISTYILVIHGVEPNLCRTFHASQIKPWTPNGDVLFSLQSSQSPGPVTLITEYSTLDYKEELKNIDRHPPSLSFTSILHS